MALKMTHIINMAPWWVALRNLYYFQSLHPMTNVCQIPKWISALWGARYCPMPWWSHQIETFSALLALCAGNSPLTGEFPSQSPVTRSFDVSLICALDTRVNNREDSDLKRHRAHYDVILMNAGQSRTVELDPIIKFQCYLNRNLNYQNKTSENFEC